MDGILWKLVRHFLTHHRWTRVKILKIISLGTLVSNNDPVNSFSGSSNCWILVSFSVIWACKFNLLAWSSLRFSMVRCCFFFWIIYWPSRLSIRHLFAAGPSSWDLSMMKMFLFRSLFTTTRGLSSFNVSITKIWNAAVEMPRTLL